MFGHSKQTTFWSQVILTILAIIFISPLIIAIKISLQGEGIGNYFAVLKTRCFHTFLPIVSSFPFLPLFLFMLSRFCRPMLFLNYRLNIRNGILMPS